MKFSSILASVSVLLLAPFIQASPTVNVPRTIPGGIISPVSEANLTRGHSFKFIISGIPQTSDRWSASISARLDGTGNNTQQFYLNLDAIAYNQTTFNTTLTVPVAAPKGFYYFRVFETAINKTDATVYIAQGTRTTVNIV